MADITKIDSITSQKIVLFIICQSTNSVMIQKNDGIVLELDSECNPVDIIEGYLEKLPAITKYIPNNIIAMVDGEVFTDYWYVELSKDEYLEAFLQVPLVGLDSLKNRDYRNLPALTHSSSRWIIALAFDHRTNKPLGSNSQEMDQELKEQYERMALRGHEGMSEVSDCDEMVGEVFNLLSSSNQMFSMEVPDIELQFGITGPQMADKFKEKDLEVEFVGAPNGKLTLVAAQDIPVLEYGISQAGYTRITKEG